MASNYPSEDEQVEALKRWWSENGKSTVVSVVVAVAAVFGWQGYQKQQQAKLEAASAVYQNMVTAAFGTNGQPSEKQATTAVHLADRLKSDFPDLTYARFAALYKARFAAEAGDYEQAESELRWALEKSALPEVSTQIKVRLARVLYAQDRFDDALAVLQGDASGYSAGFEEIKGDIFQAQGNKEAALSAYQKALDLNRESKIPVNNPLLQIKLEQLKSAMDAADSGVADV